MALVLNQFKVKEPEYFHRDYKNDLKIETPAKAAGAVNQGLRVAKAALPFVALYKPAGSVLTVIMGGCRAISNASQLYQAYFEDKGRLKIAGELLNTTVAVVSVSCAFFALPLGMLVTTCHDLAMNCIQLHQAWHEKDPAKAREMVREAGLQILTNAVYLGLFFTASLEVLVASIALQILVGLYQTSGEFQKGNYLEVVAGLLMVAVRMNQAAAPVKEFHKQWKEAIESKRQAIVNCHTAKAAIIDSGQISSIDNSLDTNSSCINPEDLAKLVNMPFNGPIKTAFYMRDTNIRGESVGEAFFASKGQPNTKCIVWYWHPKNGFDVINFSELGQTVFTGVRINNVGIVAGSYRNCWFWWSKEQGLHTSQNLFSSLSIADINDHGKVLFNGPPKHAYSIGDIHNINELQTYAFQLKEVENSVKKWLIEYCTNPHNMVPGREHLEHHQDKFRLCWAENGAWAHTLTNDGKVQGTIKSACQLLRSEPPTFNYGWPFYPLFLEVSFDANDPSSTRISKRS